MPLTPEADATIDVVANLLAPDLSLLFVTGAGISADSGLPTYRGAGGLYAHDQPTAHGMPIELALSGPTLRQHPEITWAHLRDLEERSRGATFNRGHEVIAEMERHFPRVWTLTQNVDGFHRAAGSRHVIDIHGDLHDLRCQRCAFRETVSTYEELDPLPLCPFCHEVLRPDAVLFEEELPYDKLATLYEQLAMGFDIVFSVGTSSLFPYIQQPVAMARDMGVPTVEINPSTTDISHVVTHRIEAGAAESLDALWTRYRASHPAAFGL